MFRKISFALLAGASTLAVNLHPAAAIEATEPTVVYADQMPQRPVPVRTASADRAGMGGGFIEFLFSDGQSGRRPPPSYEPRRALLPPMDPQQSLRQEDTNEVARPSFDPKYAKQTVDYHGKEGAGTIVIDTPNKLLF